MGWVGEKVFSSLNGAVMDQTFSGNSWPFQLHFFQDEIIC